MKKLYIVAKGRVQGVGYRKFIVNSARSIKEIEGFVRNLPKGEVEILAIGDENRLNQLVAASKEGPVFSRVTNVEISDVTKEDKKDLFSLVEKESFRAIL